MITTDEIWRPVPIRTQRTPYVADLVSQAFGTEIEKSVIEKSVIAA